jgi:HD-GYP domain-containing protein (c-di-GMP phosphodiesterase class II)
VAGLARAIAEQMGLSPGRVDAVGMAGEIHDIGKIAIPAEILSKPARLSALEFSLVKAHVQAGYDIIKDIAFPRPIARMVLEHHETMDGSGYPNGLTGANINIKSRILRVSDVVEAMASHRPYRPARGIDAALEELMKFRGVRYDTNVVDACLTLFREKGYTLQG